MNYLLAILTFALWALLHSLTAARAFKEFVQRHVGERMYEGFYRLFYNLFAVVSILPFLYVLATQVPATVLWRIPMPVAVLFVLVQIVGVVGLAISLLQTDALRFVGLRQVIRYLQGHPDPDPPPMFVASGTYALVRHPLYFFSLLFIWFTPVMTLNTLLFNVVATLYFWLGALHEERRLLDRFGTAYRQYRQQVPMFIPFLRL